MNSTIQLLHHNLPNSEQQSAHTITNNKHLLLNNRKDSQGSITTKASENSDSLDIENFECQHFCQKHQRHCQKCGVYFQNKDFLHGVKSERFFGSCWNIRNLRQSSKRFQMKSVKPLDFVSKDVIEKTSQKFGFSLITQSLGVYIYYTVFQGKDQFVQVVVSLFVAAKLLEHTYRKGLRKYRKYLNKCFSYSQYQEMEEIILQKMGFDLAIPTFMDFIFSYLYQGVGISNQGKNPVQAQNLLLEKGKQILFKGSFMMLAPQVTACKLLHQVRNKIRPEDSWNDVIQGITDLLSPSLIVQVQQPTKGVQL